MKTVPLLLTLLYCLNPFCVRAEESAPDYRTLKLSRGIEIDVPKDWNALNGPEKHEPVATVKPEFFNEPPASGKVVFEAYSPDRNAPARVMIEVQPAPMSPEKLADLTPVELSAVSEQMQKNLVKSDSLKISPLQKVKIGDCWATEHFELIDLSGIKVIVRQTYVITGKNQLHIWLSYPEGNPDYWKPVMAHIRESLKTPVEK